MTIELEPQPKKKLIVFPQDKGGIGKSFIATLVYDYFKDHSVKVKTFDLDHANSTFQRFVPEAEFIDTDVDASKLAVLDTMVNALETVDVVLVDIRQNTKGEAFTIKIENRLYASREEAGDALNRLVAKHHLSAKVVDVGEFAGFGLQLWPERVKEIVLRGKNAYVANISDAPLGTISSLEHVVRSLDERINECRNELAQTKHRLEELQPHAHKSFEHEEKLKGLIQRQQEIVQALDLTKNQASNSLAAEPTKVVEESIQESQSIRANFSKRVEIRL